MVPEDTLVDSFTEFVKLSEPRLRHALSAVFGSEMGKDLTAEAFSYGWEHWEGSSPISSHSCLSLDADELSVGSPCAFAHTDRLDRANAAIADVTLWRALASLSGS